MLFTEGVGVINNYILGSDDFTVKDNIDQGKVLLTSIDVQEQE